MANKNPERPTENVPLGGEPTPFKIPEGQLSKKDAHEKARADITKVLKAIDHALEGFARVPGDEMLDNSLTSLNFCKNHLTQAVGMLKE